MSTNEKPWELEPDELKWIDAATGLHCLIRRASHSGHLCGYVRVPHSTLRKKLVHRMRQPGWGLEKRIARKSGYGHRALKGVEVHGGLTFCDTIRGRRGLYLGFDCGHLDDLSPKLNDMFRPFTSSGTYRDMAYVKGEVTQLARQLHDIVQYGAVLDIEAAPSVEKLASAYGHW